MTATPQRKRGRPVDGATRAQRREDILAAAALVFAQRGYPGTDMQALADVAGVAKGTLYLYFPSKEDLFLEGTPEDRFEELGGLEKEIAQLQRAGIPSNSAEALLERTVNKIDELCAERDRLKQGQPRALRGRTFLR